VACCRLLVSARGTDASEGAGGAGAGVSEGAGGAGTGASEGAGAGTGASEGAGGGAGANSAYEACERAKNEALVRARNKAQFWRMF